MNLQQKTGLDSIKITILEGSHIHLKLMIGKFFFIPCLTIEHAVLIESEIKKMKSRKYIENLKKYPAMIARLLKTIY